ncbi:MAG TPA: prepilin peptidase [Gemmatimonadaceae bacterium]|nr:prepilin peptidase [Gemmatimonadaceae bacterium]
MTGGIALAFAFLVGALIGSFLNVCVSRWPLEESVVHPRSRCPSCRLQIAWYDNVPILSWLLLRGRCRGCGVRISPVYPLVELVVALGWLAAAMEFGPTFTALRVAIFGTVLLGIMLTDASHYTIPDGFTAFGVLWALIATVIGTFIGETLPFAGLYDAVVGACVGAGAIAIAGWVGEMVFKKEAMGFGDVTLMAMVGAHLGTGRTLLTVFFGALLGAVIFLAVVYPVAWLTRGRANDQMELPVTPVAFELPLVPFGVFLAPAAMISLIWGDALIDWYIHRMLGL